MSQFERYHGLVAAFHVIRDISLSGKIPFIFFDEFDAANNDGKLGWLKYFLAPMQDAEFKDGGYIHPLGLAICVFAGGTSSSYQAFQQEESGERKTSAARQEEEQPFIAAKGPDSLSRLRGFINVMGPNRQHPNDDAFILRRALLLRSLIERTSRATRVIRLETAATQRSGRTAGFAARQYVSTRCALDGSDPRHEPFSRQESL